MPRPARRCGALRRPSQTGVAARLDGAHEVADDPLMRARVRRPRADEALAFVSPARPTPTPGAPDSQVGARRRDRARSRCVPSVPVSSSAPRIARIHRRRRFDQRRARRSRTRATAAAVSSTSIACSRVAVAPETRATGAEHPQQQVDGVDGLVHQRAAAVERQVPRHASRCSTPAADTTSPGPRPAPACRAGRRRRTPSVALMSGMQPILEAHTELDAGLRGLGDAARRRARS